MQPYNGLDTLDPDFLAKVMVFLSQLVVERIPVVVIETTRTLERQQVLFDQGKSTTLNSAHLRGVAIDIAPVKEFREGKVRSITWSAVAPVWKRISAIGKGVGLKWGGDWQSFPDYQHFEDDGLVSESCPRIMVPSLKQ